MAYDRRREQKTFEEHGVMRIGSIHSMGDRHPGWQEDHHGCDAVSADLHDPHGRIVVFMDGKVRQDRTEETDWNTGNAECSGTRYQRDAEMSVLRKIVLSRHRHIGTPDVFVVRQLHEAPMTIRFL